MPYSTRFDGSATRFDGCHNIPLAKISVFFCHRDSKQLDLYKKSSFGSRGIVPTQNEKFST